jgi:hypothetical protein
MQNAQRAELILQKFVYLVLPRNALMFETSLHEDKGLVWLSVALDQLIDRFFKKNYFFKRSTFELLLSSARTLANLEGLAIESCHDCRLRFLLRLRLLWRKHLLRLCTELLGQLLWTRKFVEVNSPM